MAALAQLKPVKQDFVAIARRLGEGFAKNSAEADATDSFIAANYPPMKEAGLISAGVPTELGGGGALVDELCAMLRELAHHCGSTALALSMHTHQVAIPAWRWRHQKATPVEPLLKRVAAERIVLLTSGGSDWIPGTGKAEKVEGGFRVTARKIFSSGAPIGDLLMTAAVLEEPGQPAQVLHFGIPMSSPNVKILETWKAHGMRATGSHDIMIDGHVVPEAAVALRRPAGEWHMIFHVTVMLAFPLIYAAYLGVAESARDIAVSLAKKRRQDRHIVELAGRMDTELRAAQWAHAAMVQCALKGEPGPATVNEIMIGRHLVARHSIAATELAMETAGGQGFYRSQGLERRFRDIQGARYHPMQQGPQAEFAGAIALGLPTEKLF
jgi:alkylation response protein AidB-like acyl-CoA dehydrogenase